jgi:hypothetical protein
MIGLLQLFQGGLDGRRGLAITTAYVHMFFDVYLKSAPANRLDSLRQAFPDVQVVPRWHNSTGAPGGNPRGWMPPSSQHQTDRAPGPGQHGHQGRSAQEAKEPTLRPVPPCVGGHLTTPLDARDLRWRLTRTSAPASPASRRPLPRLVLDIIKYFS